MAVAIPSGKAKHQTRIVPTTKSGRLFHARSTIFGRTGWLSLNARSCPVNSRW